MSWCGSTTLPPAPSREALPACAEFYEHSVRVFDTRDAKAALKAAVEAVDTGRPFPKSNFEEQ